MLFKITPLKPLDKWKYNTIQYNTIQYNTIQYNTIQYNTIQYNTVALCRIDLPNMLYIKVKEQSN